MQKINTRYIYIYIFHLLAVVYYPPKKSGKFTSELFLKQAAVREKNSPLHSSAAAWLAEEVGRRTAKKNNLKMMGWKGQMKFPFFGGGPNV